MSDPTLDPATQDELRDQYVGERFYDQEANEAFTVVGVDEMFLLMQYEDGTAWDETPNALDVPPEVADRTDTTVDGLDNPRFVPLGSGPRLDRACQRGDHDYTPTADKLWDSPPGNQKRHIYSKIAQCRDCGLSYSVLASFLDHARFPAWWCTDCNTFSEDGRFLKDDQYRCPDCADQADLDPV